MISKSLHERLQAGASVWGSVIRSRSDYAVDIFAAAGFDVILVDCQHSLISESAAVQMLAPLRETDVAGFIRVSANDPALIGSVLDGGADGVIVPMVETAEAAASAAAAVRYAPTGARSWGPMPWAGSDPDTVQARARCYVMLESEAGIANAEAICGTPGVDGVYMGPADLAISLGERWGDGTGAPRTRAALSETVAICRSAGIVPGIAGGSGSTGAEFAAIGYRFVTVAVDNVLLSKGAARELESARRGAVIPA